MLAEPPTPGNGRARGWFLVTLEILACLALACGIARILPHGGAWDASMFRPDEPARFYETPRWAVTFVIEVAVLIPAARIFLGHWTRADFGLAHPFATLGECCSILVLRVLIASIGVLLIPGIAEAVWAPYAIRTQADLLVFVLWISPFVAGFGEEVLFRSYIQGAWMGVNVAWGAVAAAVAFALLHGFQGLVPLLGMHLPTGLLVVGVYAQRRDLPSQILGHALFDVVIFAELFAVHEGKVAKGPLAVGLFALCGVALFLLRRHVRSTFAATWDLLRSLRADLRHAPFAVLAGAALLAAFRFFSWR
jgi:membrane protease YdiL (CAAX protease family)